MREIKVRIISDYQNASVESWLKQQSKNNDCSYAKGQFKVIYTTENIPTDYTIMINKVDQDTAIDCPLQNIWGIQQEPFIEGNLNYAIPFKNEFAKKPQTYAQCSKIFAFVPKLLEQKDKFIASPPYIYWLLEHNRTQSFQDIASFDFFSNKHKEISCIANLDKKAFAGHINRANFVKFLKNTPLPIHYFGGEKSHNFIQTKLEALKDYRYSIAIENSSIPFYFSEKITDCFLAGCMPFYYGANNIADFFPKESFVWIDIHNPKESAKIIEDTLKEKKWEKNLDYIMEARRRVLEDYNFLQIMGEKIIEDASISSSPPQRTPLIIKGYKRSFSTHLLRNLQRVYFLILRPVVYLQKFIRSN